MARPLARVVVPGWSYRAGLGPVPFSYRNHGPLVRRPTERPEPADQPRKRGLSGRCGRWLGTVLGPAILCIRWFAAGSPVFGAVFGVFRVLVRHALSLLRQTPTSRFQGHKPVMSQRAERGPGGTSVEAGHGGPFAL